MTSSPTSGGPADMSGKTMPPFTVGIISDTHRHLPEGAIAVLRGDYDDNQIRQTLEIDGEPKATYEKTPVDLIIHAGDIGGWAPLSQDILNELERIAPVCAVLGNCDVEGYIVGDTYVSGQMALVERCGMQIAVMHRPEDLTAAIRASGISPRVRIHGHTHIPKLERLAKNGMLICPGSPTEPRGRSHEPTVALLHLAAPDQLLCAEIVAL